MFQKIAHAEICAGLTDPVKLLNDALSSGDLNVRNIQAARLNIGGFYTAKIAYWKLDLDDKFVRLFKILEFQSDTKRMRHQLTQRISDAKRDLIKKKIVD